MGTEYLYTNIFGMAINELATGTGSISKRLMDAHIVALYKIRWENDIKYIPQENKKDFIHLKKIVWDEIIEKLNSKRTKVLLEYANMGIQLKEEQLEKIVNFNILLKSLHWQKAQKAARLIFDIHFWLYLSIKDKLYANSKLI